MARWQRREPARIEPPGWYRTFDPRMWDAMDAHEESMFDGCPGMRPWPDRLHDFHSRRRWAEAKHAYRQEHPALAEQEFTDIQNSEARAREDERHA